MIGGILIILYGLIALAQGRDNAEVVVASVAGIAISHYYWRRMRHALWQREALAGSWMFASNGLFYVEKGRVKFVTLWHDVTGFELAQATRENFAIFRVHALSINYNNYEDESLSSKRERRYDPRLGQAVDVRSQGSCTLPLSLLGQTIRFRSHGLGQRGFAPNKLLEALDGRWPRTREHLEDLFRIWR